MCTPEKLLERTNTRFCCMLPHQELKVLNNSKFLEEVAAAWDKLVTQDRWARGEEHWRLGWLYFPCKYGQEEEKQLIKKRFMPFLRDTYN